MDSKMKAKTEKCHLIVRAGTSSEIHIGEPSIQS